MDLFFSTSLNGVGLAAVIQRHLFLSFFLFVDVQLPANTSPSFSVTQTPWQQKTAGVPACKSLCWERSQILSARHFQLGVMRLLWVEMPWLCCESSATSRCAVRTALKKKKTTKAYESCTSQHHGHQTCNKSTVLPLVQWLERRERSFILILRGIWGVCGDRYIPCVTQSLQTTLLF